MIIKRMKKESKVKELKHEFNTGDLVYTATAQEVDRDVIKAIKFKGLKNKVSYAFKESGSPGMFSFYWGNSDYRWLSANDVFATEEEAEKAQKQLQRKADADKEAERMKEIAEMEDDVKRRKENLRRKKLGLEELDDEE